MKTQKLKSIISIIIFCIIILLTSKVNAYNVSMNLSTNSTMLEPSRTYTINASIVNNNTGDGIDTIMATLEYDENIFDKTATVVNATNGWSPLYDDETGSIILQKMKKTNSNDIFLTFILKTKDNLSANETLVKLKDVTMSGGSVADGGTADIYIPEVNLKFSTNANETSNTGETVTSEDNNAEKQGSRNNGASTNNSNNNNNSNNVSSTVNNKEETSDSSDEAQKEQTIPAATNNKATAEKTKGNAGVIIAILIVVVVLLTVSVIVFFKKIKNKKVIK